MRGKGEGETPSRADKHRKKAVCVHTSLYFTTSHNTLADFYFSLNFVPTSAALINKIFNLYLQEDDLKWVEENIPTSGGIDM